MTVGAGALCFACKRWNGRVCDAFPDGIPESIMFDGFDHRQPHEGDNGKRFVLGDEDQLNAYEQVQAIIASFEPPEVRPEQAKARYGQPKPRPPHRSSEMTSTHLG